MQDGRLHNLNCVNKACSPCCSPFKFVTCSPVKEMFGIICSKFDCSRTCYTIYTRLCNLPSFAQRNLNEAGLPLVGFVEYIKALVGTRRSHQGLTVAPCDGLAYIGWFLIYARWSQIWDFVRSGANATPIRVFTKIV